MLLLSTDPAHSVGDALGQAFSDNPRRLPGGPSNLVVRELDARRALGSLRERLAAAVDALFAGSTSDGTGSMSGDRQVVHDLLELAPPGIDEIAATMQVVDGLVPDAYGAACGHEYDLVVMDTAPTGHALRLLEMPALVHAWVKALMGILLKYRSVVGLGDLGAELVDFSQGLGRLRELLNDPARARFVAVSRLAELPRAETVRLLNRLRAAGIGTPLLVMNAAGAGTCRRCGTGRRTQMRELHALRAATGRGPAGPRLLLLAPAEFPPPRGRRSLVSWHRRWRQLA